MTFFIHHNRLSLRKCFYLELKSRVTLPQFPRYSFSWKNDLFVNQAVGNLPLDKPRDWQRETDTCVTFMQCICTLVLR
jgi:hypothetical protein